MNSASPLLEGLNPGQLAAVTAPDGPALVIAAAGTGKTRTLTHRVAWLARERAIDPFNILLLTFTNRAADEMLSRAEYLMRGIAARPWGGTFHSVCNRILRANSTSIGFSPSFTILDDDDSTRLLKTCAAELGARDKDFPKPDVLSSLFGLAASREQPLADLLLETRPDPKDNDAILAIQDLYARKKRDMDAMDFDDLIVHAVRLLRESPAVRDFYNRRFRHILVDEFQDTSRLQSSLVDLLAGPATSLMVVGDDFQGIYSWRGADIENFLSFEASHPGTRLYKLEENYRSAPAILRVANCVIAGNPRQYQKTLRPVRPEAASPVRAILADGRHQARYVVEKIMQLLDSGAAKPEEIAVLYRSHFHSVDLQMELSRAQIPFSVVSGTRFFESAHVKDVCSLLQLVANPRNVLAFVRLVSLLPGIGEKKARTLWDKLSGAFDPRTPDAWDLAAKSLPPAARELWTPLRDAFFPDHLRTDEAAAAFDRPADLVDAFYNAFYKDYIRNAFDNPDSRAEDVKAFSGFCLRFADTAALLSELSLLTNLDAAPADDARDLPSIRLTTIHQAKGLEWKAVFVLWLAESMFPTARAAADPSACEEERRLFYVAVTRARDYLWLCSPQFNRTRPDAPAYCPPSRFLDEIVDSDSSLLTTERPPSSPWNAPAHYARWR